MIAVDTAWSGFMAARAACRVEVCVRVLATFLGGKPLWSSGT